MSTLPPRCSGSHKLERARARASVGRGANGRITGTAGDSVLAKFGSVVDALDCAVKIQDALVVANKSAPPENRLLFRIGINVGDVMLNAISLAMASISPPALNPWPMPAAFASRAGVRDHVRKMGQYAFEDLGEQSFRNIAQPIRA